MPAKRTPAPAGVDGMSRPVMLEGFSRANRVRYWGPLALVLVVSLALRLWGIKQGLPYVYNVDEYGHFVPEAVAMFHRGLNPHYFINPPALTYFLHFVYAVWLVGRGNISREFALHPDHFFLLARVTVALLGTASVGLLYLVGARLFNRGVGLLAATLMGVAFLPVYYGHLALNDAPTLVPLTLSLLGTAGILRRGRLADYLLAGTGLGLAGATKYTAIVVMLPLLAAAWARYRLAGARERRQVAVGIGLAAITAIVAFVIANPFSVLDFHRFSADISRQSNYTQMSRASWVGGPRDSGVVYYLWSFTWGLGWVPALAALGGLATVWRSDGRLGWLLVPAPVVYLAFLSLQGRYFGRWLLPILPIACLLAASFALALTERARRRAPPLRAALVVLAVLALSVQGLLYSIHSGLVLSRADTRNLARQWMIAHIPAGARIVVEPVVPNVWLANGGREAARAHTHARWVAYPTLRLALNPSDGSPEPAGRRVLLENYERTLGPALVSYYEQHGFCWVLSGFTQAGRAFVDPHAMPNAIAYYRVLAQRARVIYHVSPYGRGDTPVGFGFDWTFDYYPLAYYRPGPEITVYRLGDGRCANVTEETNTRSARKL
jgi:Dolichyl-phosphate-mannose-protein mannosyltransferase